MSSRLVEEVKQRCPDVQLQNEDVYMATTFRDFIQMLVRKLRGEDQEEELLVDYVGGAAYSCGGRMFDQCSWVLDCVCFLYRRRCFANR